MFVLNVKSLFAMFAIHLRETKIQMDGFTANKYRYSCKRKSDLLKRRTKSIIAGAVPTDKLRDAWYGYVVHIMIYVYTFIYRFHTVAYKYRGPW